MALGNLVPLALDGGDDRFHRGGGVKGHCDAGRGDVDGDGIDAGHTGDGALDRRLAVIAMDFWHRDGGLGHDVSSWMGPATTGAQHRVSINSSTIWPVRPSATAWSTRFSTWFSSSTRFTVSSEPCRAGTCFMISGQ